MSEHPIDAVLRMARTRAASIEQQGPELAAMVRSLADELERTTTALRKIIDECDSTRDTNRCGWDRPAGNPYTIERIARRGLGEE